MNEDSAKEKDMIEANHNYDLDTESGTMTLASNVAREILVISDSDSTVDACKAAVTYLESVIFSFPSSL